MGNESKEGWWWWLFFVLIFVLFLFVVSVSTENIKTENSQKIIERIHFAIF